MNRRTINNTSKMLCLLLGLNLFAAGPKAVDAQSNANELFIVSQKAFEDGFYDVAIRYIEQLFKDYPETNQRAKANLLLGQCYFFKQQYLKAYEVFQYLQKSGHLLDASLFWLGETYLKGADYSKAEQHYQRLLKKYPQSGYIPQTHYALGWSAFEQKKFVQAREHFRSLLQHFPTHELSEDAAFKLGEAEYHLGHYRETIKYFKNYIQHFPQSTRHAQAYFYLGESHYYEEDYLTALPYYAKAADLGYDNKLILMANVSLGWCYLKLGRLKLAQKHFEDAMVMAQEKQILTDDVFLGQASLFTEQKEYAKAIEAYGRLIKEFPNSQRIDEAYLGEANAYYLLKKYPLAITSYQKLIQRLSQRASVDFLEKAYFGLAWAQLKAGHLDQAVQSFETIKNKSNSKTVKISALTQIGDAYQDIEQYDKSVAIYDRILKDFPESPYADYVQYRQGIALLKSGAIDTATLSFQSLRANFPQSRYLEDITYYLGVAHFQKNNWRAAKDKMTQFINLAVHQHQFLAEATYVLALTEFHLKNFGAAIKLFQKIKKNYPHKSSMVRNAQLNIAKCYYKTGDVKEALKRFKLLITRYAQSEAAQEALIWLSEYYFEVGDFDNAIIYYHQFIDQFPGSNKLNVVYYDLGHIYQAHNEYDQAINVLKRINEDNPHLYGKAQLAIADIFSRQFDADKAIDVYKSIIASSPEFQRTAYIKTADVLKQQAHYHDAIAAYRHALTAKARPPDLENAHIQFFIGDTFELLNQADKAIEEYLKISYLYPTATNWIVKSYLRVGRIFEDHQQWAEAQKIYEKVLILGTVEAKFARERLEWISTKLASP